MIIAILAVSLLCLLASLGSILGLIGATTILWARIDKLERGIRLELAQPVRLKMPLPQRPGKPPDIQVAEPQIVG